MAAQGLHEPDGEAMTAVRPVPAPAAGSAQPTVRRLIVYTLLFALVVVTAIGLSGLLGRLLGAGTVLVAGDVAGLARSLAFTLIGGPMAAALWWFVWRRLDDAIERSSAGWGLYLTGMYAVSLITSATGLLSAAASVIGGERLGWQLSLSNGLVWAGVLAWHRWMWRHPRKSPSLLADVPTVVGAVFGLIIGVGGTVTALANLLDTAIQGFTSSASIGDPWWRFVLQSLAWGAGGAAIWWWHWIHDGGRRLKTDFADVALVVVGILGAVLLTVGGTGTVLFVLLRLAFDRSDPVGEILEPLGAAIAAGAVGSLVWAYHRTVSMGRSDTTLQAAKLVTSGVGLVAAATGIGIVVNSALSIAATPLAGDGIRTLLLGGISALAVGGPLWWLTWKPGVPPEPTELGRRGRRVYLIAVFGLSAIVAVITLLVIGYRVFEFLLDDISGGSLVDRIRAPLGLLVATGLAAGYHFAVWRHDRSLTAAAAPRKRTVRKVILVAAGDPEPLVRVAAEVTGASVTVWRKADAGTSGAANAGAATPGAGTSVTATAAEGAAGDLPERLAEALDGVAADRVLIVIGPGSRLDVIPLGSD
ncbi:DUF5671 domain-containing protein [Arthrobacter sp. FB24]|uniref:DUF5671 domain-containing protein n=1 Tax=Arthrobacter sp. (strain FB24) TaxID=290399 RepID=UPI001E3A021D|nr:DUF5671 domain-containing protein [Arthrobacter sp. FB24]